jgi:membrane protein
LARNAFASMYGAAGSLFLVLVWIYFSAQVFFLGAEFTKVLAHHRGRRIRPEDYAFRTKTVRSAEEG